MMAKKRTAQSNAKTPAANDESQTLQQLKKLFAEPSQSDLRWCRKVGRLVERLHPTAGGRSYGEGKMQQLADELQPGGSTDLPGRLRRMQMFASWLNEHAAARQLLKGKRQDGQPLTWSYVESGAGSG